MSWYLAPSLARLRSQVARRWPNRSTASDGTKGDSAHAGRASDHNPDPKTGVVRAIDFTVNTTQGQAILAAAWQDPRTFYVIWRRKIYYRGETKPRTYAGLNAHMSHIHISIDRNKKTAETNTANWKGLGMARMQSPVKGRVTSEFSRNRKNPVTGRVEPHLGIDIAAPAGTPYYPVYPGTVIGVGAGLLPGRSGDRNVRVRNPDGETQYYGHGETVSVKVGQKVDHTTQLGTVGQRGNATGPHVHLEIHDKNGVPRNPRTDFDHHGVTPGEAPQTTTTSKKEDWFSMATEKELLAVVRKALREENIKISGATGRVLKKKQLSHAQLDRYAGASLFEGREQHADLVTRIKALTAAVDTLAKSQGVKPGDVTRAVETAVNKALEDAEITFTLARDEDQED